MDHDPGIGTLRHIRAIDMVRTALRNFVSPSIEIACRTETMVPRLA
jgi:hypothetical protein